MLRPGGAGPAHVCASPSATDMRSWLPAPTADRRAELVAGLIGHLGEARFGQALLDGLQDVLPAASWSVYRAGHTQAPALFLSASRGVPDTTRDCWRAYLSGPHRDDRILQHAAGADAPRLCHITAEEVPGEHRAKVYEAHGVAERLSLMQPQAGGAVFAINFYRHRHQRPFRDAALESFGTLAPALLALVHKHIALDAPAVPPLAAAVASESAADLDARLQRLCPALTERERIVCVRMLQGLTLEGIASDLGLALPTVKTYRGRAFARLGIHFRNQLFARVLNA